jgi:hemolysin activation/secretion protein
MDSTGLTEFSASLNMVFRGLVSDREEFEEKRFNSRGNYVYMTVGVERNQKLPKGMQLYAKIDGQLSSQPLISNEQYAAGGMQSVRGYLESEELGDDAVHATVELQGPEIIEALGAEAEANVTPFAFWDYAKLRTKEPLPGEDRWVNLRGAGLGFRGNALSSLEYEFDWGHAFLETDRTDADEDVFYFKLRYVF